MTRVEVRLLSRQKGTSGNWRPLGRIYTEPLSWIYSLELPRRQEANPDREYRVEVREITIGKWKDAT